MDRRDESDAGPTAPPYASAQFANVVTAVRDLKHPTEIGPYRVLELIGEGGMGSVYKAEQREPIRRIVAVKIIKLGMDTRQVIARFESERQALAMMNHPNVARVLDAGATETGRPYFVMEYVAGEPITRFADRHKLSLRQRLELFTQACAAVQHAHQKAIIHRDLKPSNILVTLENNTTTVKVIDFGVAKAISQRLTEMTLFTETGQLVGTPEYMAPEQAEGSAQNDIDTRGDVYSLGVVLYELLTGTLPFDAPTLRRASYQEIQRIIREVDPPRPSARLSSLGNSAQEIARLRMTQLDHLEKQLKTELEWIPLKALRKDRTQRYSSASELADDIVNYLSNRPLRAGPESKIYRARKFLRRNKTGVAASAAMFLLLLMGITATTWQAVRATRAERIAVREKQEADVQRSKAEDASKNLQEVNHFLTEDLLASASPEITRGREMTVREAVDRAAQTASQRLQGRPLTEAAVRGVLGDTYNALGLTAQGLVHAQAAEQILRRERGPDDEAALAATHQVGKLLAELDRHAEAEPILRDAYERSQRVLGDEHPVTLDCLGGLATTLRMQERFDEAEPLYRRLLEGDRRVHGPRSAEVAQSLNNLAVLLNTQLRASEAEPLYRESLAIREPLLGKDHPSYLSTQQNLARVLETQGKTLEAQLLLREVLREQRRVLKDDHPDTTLSMNNLAVGLSNQGNYEEAEALHREALAHRRRMLGEEDIDTLQSLNNLGAVLNHSGKPAEAEPFYREAFQKRTKVLGEKHPYTLGSLAGLAATLEGQGRFAEAEPLLAKVCQPDNLSLVPENNRWLLIGRYGRCLARLNKFNEAESRLLESHRGLVATHQTDGEGMRAVLGALVEVYEGLNRPTDAAKWRTDLARLDATTQPTTPR